MFAVGAMNVVWMAALGVVMTVEKIEHRQALQPGVGVVLIAVGLAFVLVVAAHWPLRRYE